MTNAEIIATIRAEIERLTEIHREYERSLWRYECYDSAKKEEGAAKGLENLLSFLSDLEKSLPTKVTAGEELENELVRFYLKDLCASEDDELTDATRHHHFPIMWDDLRDISKHFYDVGCRRTAEKYDEIEYNRQRASGSSEIPKDLEEAAEEWAENEAYGKSDAEFEMAYKGYIAGAKWDREQMMKEAYDGEFFYNPYPGIALDDCKDYDFKQREDVRIIILPKED